MDLSVCYRSNSSKTKKYSRKKPFLPTLGVNFHQDPCGRGILRFKVTDSWLMHKELVPSTAEDLPCRGLMHVKYVEVQCLPFGVEVRRGGYQIRCHPCHLIMVQNYEAHR
ncbi:hypothetical protein TNCV_4108641 [Trichonephila clavipes]|nr:hypothetical protein TNCV_4108641 [Trichonephila clavipes]